MHGHLNIKRTEYIDIKKCKEWSSFTYCLLIIVLDHLEDPGMDGRIILKWIFREWDVGGKDWIDLAQDRDRWGRL
jgi:hypothetical protein